MSSATVTVKFKDAPGEGKKTWKIKGSDNNEYYLKPDLANKVEKGSTYEFVYKTNNFNGKSFNMVDEVKAAAPQGGYAEPQTLGGQKNKDFDRNMFVMAMMKSSLEGGQIKELNSQVCINAVMMWRAVWDATLGNPQQADDLQDSIPF